MKDLSKHYQEGSCSVQTCHYNRGAEDERADIKKKIEKLPKYMENGQPLNEEGRFIRRADVLEEIE